MSRKNPSDARKKTLNNLKQAVEFPLGELLPEEQRKKLQPEKPEENIPKIPEHGEELPQPKKLPGGPSHTVRPNIPGQSGESLDVPGYTTHRPDEYTGMSPKELEQKREELGVGKEAPEEISELPKRPTWRDVVKDKLKSFDPKEKSKERMEALYGPGEQIEAIVEGLENFSTDMANVDINSARNYVESSDLPDALKERAEKLLRGVRYDPGNPRADKNGEVPISGTRVLQHALNQLGARTKPQIDKATAWMENDPKGQEFLGKARDQYLIRTTMNMMKNIILHQEGEKVIQIGPTAPRTSPEQRKENKRIKELQKLLDAGEISVEEYNSRLKQEEKATPATKEEAPRESAVPGNVATLNELQRKFNAGEITEEEYKKERARLLASRLSLRKLADTTGPGGEDWFSGYESGPQVNRDKYKKRNRFPFDNAPSSDVRVNKGPAKHDLPVPDGGGLAGDDNWGLLAIRHQMRRTADNEMFECYNYGELTKGPWFSYTLFKRAYQSFKPGDIVVQFGETPQEARTYRRRFGTVKNANRNIEAALLPAVSTISAAKKTAGSYLTPEGREILKESGLAPTTIQLPEITLPGILSYIAGNPARTLQDLLNDIEEFSADPENDLDDVQLIWRDAIKQGYIMAEEGPEALSADLSTLPKNLPPGIIGNKLNVSKTGESVHPKSIRLPGRPTPNESLHELPDSKDNPVGGVYGPRTPEYDKEPWQGNRDGFDRPKPRREMDVQRNVFPYEDQEMSNQVQIFGGLNLRKKAGLHITPSGTQKLEQLYNQLENFNPENLDPDLPIESQLSEAFPNEYDAWLLSALDGVSVNPGFKVYQIVQKLQEGGLPQDAIDELVKAIHHALISDWVEDREFNLPGNLPEGMANKLNLKKKADVGNYAAPVVETPEDRAGTIEQDIPNAINLDPARPSPPKRKRHDFNETQLYNENEHADNPLTHYTSRLNLRKTAFDFNVSIFHPQTNQFVEETILSAPSLEQAQLQAQEFVNKSFPGYSFRVMDPYTETPKTLGINSVSESRFMDNNLNLRKQADENFPSLRNELFHLFQEFWPEGEITPESVDQASNNAIKAFKERYPQIEQSLLEELARAADFLLSHDGKASNLVNVAKGIPLF